MTVNYLPSSTDGWVFLVAGESALLCKAAGDTQLIGALWDAIRSADPVEASLEAMTRRGLTAAPSFAMAVWSGVSGSDAVVLARGEAAIAVTSAGALSHIDGTSVSTWIEQRIAAVTGLSLGVRGDTIALLPLESGVVIGSWAELGAASAAPVVVPVVPVPSVDVPSWDQSPIVASSPDPRTITTLPDEIVAIPESTITELPEPVTAGYAHLFEETVVRNIEDAAVRPPEETDSDDAEANEPDAASTGVDGDHDGLTVMSGDLAELRRSRHGAPSTPAPREAAQTLSYFLELSTGGREPLVHSALVGRSPSVSKISGGQVPRLITIPGDKDISRNHVQLALEGGTVVVTDLHSRNGTSIILPGKPPQALRAGEPTPVIPGTVIDLGGGVLLTVIEERS